MNLAYPSQEFDHAVAAVCHGVATEEQQRALNALLRSHPAARDEYIVRIELHSRLASTPDLFTVAAAGPSSEPTVVPQFQPPRRVQRSLQWLAIAACAAVLLTGAWRLYGPSSAARNGSVSKAVALLSRVADATWQDPGVNPRLGGPLEPGLLRLKSGLVQIVLYSGTRMVIEGPAEVRLVSQNEVACLSGRLVAEVPPPAKGFLVRTPRMDVTDLGTVFGVDVSAASAELHVFKGSVEFQTIATQGRQSLVEGQAAIADDASPARFAPTSRTRFASLFELQNKSSQAQVLRHEQWRAASSRLDEDPSLLVHFDFELADPSDWRLANVSRRKDVMQDAVIVGCQGSEGRWPDKRAIEFRGASDRVRLEAVGEHNALTLTAWVRVQGLDREINSLFMSDGFEAGTVHWSIRRDGVLALTAIGVGPGEFQICASPPALRIDQFGLWTQLAVVIDSDSKRVTHYMNGVRVSDQALRIAGPFRIGTAELGNWNARGFPKNDPFMIRNFSGAMDDFCIFSRALSAGEIRALHAVGKPQPDFSATARN